MQASDLGLEYESVESWLENLGAKSMYAVSFDENRLVVQLKARQVFLANTELHLSRLEGDVLAYLIEHIDCVVGYEELWLAVWREAGIFTKDELAKVRETLKRLRRRLEAATVRWEGLVCVRGVGIRLRAQSVKISQ